MADRRPVTDWLLIMVAGTVCLLILGGATAVVLVEAVNPETDTSRAVSLLVSVVNTLIGIMTGVLLGHGRGRQRGDDEQSK